MYYLSFIFYDQVKYTFPFSLTKIVLILLTNFSVLSNKRFINTSSSFLYLCNCDPNLLSLDNPLKKGEKSTNPLAFEEEFSVLFPDKTR